MSKTPPPEPDEVACPRCGAVYELGHEGRRVREKDDARCQFCRTVITSWPASFSIKVVKEPAQDELP